MVKIDSNFNQTQTNQTDSSANQSTSTHSNQNNQTKPQSGLMTIIGQLLPLAPFAFEQFTGQKVPQMSGTIAEMQVALIQISTNLQVLANHQQAFSQRLAVLETKLTEIQTSANQHLTNLTHQFQSLRLTHTREREKKAIEYNPPTNLENQEY